MHWAMSTGGLGDRLYVEALFDQVAQPALAQQFGGGGDRDRPIPSISQISSSCVVPRRSASASMSTRVSTGPLDPTRSHR